MQKRRKEMKHYSDARDEICKKRAKCNATIKRLKKKRRTIDQSLQHANESLSLVNDEHTKLSYKIDHPLYAFFGDLMPEVLIEICKSYTTMDYCASHEDLYPSLFGCINCLPRDDFEVSSIKCQCEKQDINIDHNDIDRYETDWSSVVFSTENSREI